MNKQYKVIIISCSFITALIIATGYSNLKRLDRIEESIENIQVDVNAEFDAINNTLDRLESQYHRLEDENTTLEDNIFLKLQ